MLNDISNSPNGNSINLFKKDNPLNVTGKKNNDPAKKIVLANKGEAGYNIMFDTDGDGIITLEEFNRYCEENSIDEKDKLKMLSVMQSAKTVETLQKESEKAKKEDGDDKDNTESNAENNAETDNGTIYARKGDKKYNEKMDENKDSVITYTEYTKYCQKAANKQNETDNNPENQAENKISKAYSLENEEGEICVDCEA